ncbi:MAG: hypothetical protein CMI62_06390 [Parvibaculum sp.]|jgi:tetratricopeptide (TPR) repeat protein|uniref:SPOR domain-containing protein n=1 Tax=Parvibaculum sp. TaxID=2024848 RepID=UPI000C512076|nr:tetratricopeptide repeat protein [Parvibaculum sp.]MAU60344.1 hypothetical protein [Parvibaculum sp.]|tara:strand:+ start:10958 stop:12244 length:1287 start_codon:yes stop_codon:yes gene_type:complete
MRRLFEAGEYRRHCGRRASLALVPALAGLCIALVALPVRAGDAKEEATAFMKGGVEAVERGVYDRAVPQFSKALDSGGLSVEETALAWHHRGVAFQKMGQREAAIGDYTKAIESGALPAKVLPKAYYNRGIALANTGQESAAERDYLEALRLDPGYAAAYHNLANLERRRGDHSRAILHYSAAIDHMKGRERKLPLFGRALSLEQQGKIDEASEDLKLALALDPEFDLAETKLKALSPMLSENARVNEVARSEARVVPSTLAPFQAASSGNEGGHTIRVASLGGWRTTATRFPTTEDGSSSFVEASPPSGELVTGSLRPTEEAVSPDKRQELAADNSHRTLDPVTRYRIQLGAFREEALAKKAWNEISGDASGVLGGESPQIQRADLGPKGVFYRLRAGAFGDISAAKSACKALEQRKIACFVVKRDA